MTPLFSLILIVLLAYVGAVFFQKSQSKSLLLKGISHSGLHYLILGYFLGPYVFDVINVKVLEELSVVLAFVLGWTGFLIGLQINFKQMRRFQISYYWNALLIIFTTYLLMFAGSLIIVFIFNLDVDYLVLMIFTLAASISSLLIMGTIKKEWNLRGKLIHFTQFQLAYDNMLGIILIGVLIAIQGIEFLNKPRPIFNFLITVFIVSILSIIFYFISKELKNIQQYFLIIVGFLLLVVGTAMHMNQSSLFIAFLFGFAIANLPINSWKLFQTIANTEKPIYLLLLILIGAGYLKIDYNILVISVLYSFWRLLIKYLTGFLIYIPLNINKKIVNKAGLLGVGMGGVSLALILDFQMINNSQNIEFMIGLLLFTFVINDGLSFVFTKPLINHIKRK